MNALPTWLIRLIHEEQRAEYERVRSARHDSRRDGYRPGTNSTRASPGSSHTSRS